MTASTEGLIAEANARKIIIVLMEILKNESTRIRKEEEKLGPERLYCGFLRK